MNKDTSSAKDFFLHLLSSITLYMSAVAFLIVAFQLIGYFFPDVSVESWRGDYSSDALRIGISMLLITLPIFFWTRMFLAKMYVTEPERKEFKFRKWLMYLTLFVSAIIIIVSLIMTVNVFLSGDLTARFFSKVLATVFVAIIVLTYYFSAIKDTLTKQKRNMYLWATSVISIALVVSSFAFIGSPQKARLQRFDNERISDLNALMYVVQNYYATHEVLPTSLDAIQSPDMLKENTVDTITLKPYGYTVKSDTTYTLCATFDTDTKDASAPRDSTSGWWDSSWVHQIGEYCFERTVDIVPVKDGFARPMPVVE
ncbi:MAG: hypothetical protein COV60_00565 [Candidatus Magasanikbacteria bacterium CG11_big_fil_rev_8_21_14_0_20_43_7]|uniref:DUF5671 domain-containing protein n=1 Tax=Candidatus Magasanikbacteria bacterium CG11_big_fil_rev_8_21_14_0_20_43_7 TaxID=1974654 RepID=A0A2H0N3C4_9BACT|nr:MAG: hypothetical protein COV60_00565 [Candidatus Magasanikbacteria bacterium CG11_big_fil_rev_8_21_14_0_20_43_7]